MKIDIPFHKSIKDTECAQRCLQMVADHFGQKSSLSQLKELTKQTSSGITWTAGIARAAHELEFKTKIISQTNFSHEDKDIEYYKNSGDDNLKTLYGLIEELKKKNVLIEEENLSLEELLGLLNENQIPIVLINWFSLANISGYSGHFIVLSGHDKEHIYAHNPGIANAGPFMKIKKENFLKAWESKGTDKDVVLIFRK